MYYHSGKYVMRVNCVPGCSPRARGTSSPGSCVKGPGKVNRGGQSGINPTLMSSHPSGLGLEIDWICSVNTMKVWKKHASLNGKKECFLALMPDLPWWVVG